MSSLRHHLLSPFAGSKKDGSSDPAKRMWREDHPDPYEKGKGNSWNSSNSDTAVGSGSSAQMSNEVLPPAEKSPPSQKKSSRIRFPYKVDLEGEGDADIAKSIMQNPFAKSQEDEMLPERVLGYDGLWAVGKGFQHTCLRGSLRLREHCSHCTDCHIKRERERARGIQSHNSQWPRTPYPGCGVHCKHCTRCHHPPEGYLDMLAWERRTAHEDAARHGSRKEFFEKLSHHRHCRGSTPTRTGEVPEDYKWLDHLDNAPKRIASWSFKDPLMEVLDGREQEDDHPQKGRAKYMMDQAVKLALIT